MVAFDGVVESAFVCLFALEKIQRGWEESTGSRR